MKGKSAVFLFSRNGKLVSVRAKNITIEALECILDDKKN
jgi:hypothetical protein